MAKRHHIFIVGESALVREYAVEFLSKKHTVTVRFNPGETSQLPKGAKRSVTPPKAATLALELTNTSAVVKKKNLTQLDRSLAADVLIISSSTTVTATEQSTWIKNPERLIGIGALPSLLEGSLIEFAPTPGTNQSCIAKARDVAALLGKEAALVHDSIGLVMPRILCMLANEAYFALMEDVASPDDIDTAMKLGTNYPMGPLERAERIGITHVHTVLSALYNHFGEDRYRIAPLLRQVALKHQ